MPEIEPPFDTISSEFWLGTGFDPLYNEDGGGNSVYLGVFTSKSLSPGFYRHPSAISCTISREMAAGDEAVVHYHTWKSRDQTDKIQNLSRQR